MKSLMIGALLVVLVAVASAGRKNRCNPAEANTCGDGLTCEPKLDVNGNPRTNSDGTPKGKCKPSTCVPPASSNDPNPCGNDLLKCELGEDRDGNQVNRCKPILCTESGNPPCECSQARGSQTEEELRCFVEGFGCGKRGGRRRNSRRNNSPGEEDGEDADGNTAGDP